VAVRAGAGYPGSQGGSCRSGVGRGRERGAQIEAAGCRDEFDGEDPSQVRDLRTAVRASLRRAGLRRRPGR